MATSRDRCEDEEPLITEATDIIKKKGIFLECVPDDEVVFGVGDFPLATRRASCSGRMEGAPQKSKLLRQRSKLLLQKGSCPCRRASCSGRRTAAPAEVKTAPAEVAAASAKENTATAEEAAAPAENKAVWQKRKLLRQKSKLLQGEMRHGGVHAKSPRNEGFKMHPCPTWRAP